MKRIVSTKRGATFGGVAGPAVVVAVATLAVVAGLVALSGSVTAGETGAGDGLNATVPCDFPKDSWRDAQTIDGVQVDASKRCVPDNPWVVAAATKGTNNVETMTVMRSGLARDAVVKTNDRDGDGDPDVINVTLEITGINERNETDVTQRIAPGIRPSFWTFSPKARGMVSRGSKAEWLVQMPSVSLRAEEGDTIYLHVENTHYLPHTIHLHGTDHPFTSKAGATTGNDGVPQTSEKPIMPGEERVYELTPREAGTMFYHCHVVPNVHVGMGLNGLFVIEEDRDNNWVQTLNVGAGKVRHPSRKMDEQYDAEYDLVYQSVEKTLHSIPKQYDDTRVLARKLNREYDLTDESADYFLLNGRSFPYTLWESVVNVEPDSRYRLRVMNSGGETMSIHTHGHKFREVAYDGVERPDGHAIQRDVFTITSAQRIDLELVTKNDGLNSYGPGNWIFHDHREHGVTNDGVSPGGTISMITYPEYRTSEGIPKTSVDLGRFFDEDYYEGEVPYWGRLDEDLYGDPPWMAPVGDGPNADDRGDEAPMLMDMNMQMQMVPDGTVINENTDELPPGCSEVSGNHSVTVAGGQEWAEPGEAFGYNRTEFDFEQCERVTITFVNTDEIRHQWMLHGLPTDTYPMGMFNIEVRRNGRVSATFITPAENETLHLHCSLPQHEQKGMHADVHVGSGGDHHGSVADPTGRLDERAAP